MTTRNKVFRGERLKEVRERRGMTQEDLNKRLSLGNTQIYRYETGKADPSPEIIVKLARELEVTSDYLLGLVQNPQDRLLEQNLTPDERKLLSAYRRGDLHDLMRAVVERPVADS